MSRQIRLRCQVFQILPLNRFKVANMSLQMCTLSSLIIVIRMVDSILDIYQKICNHLAKFVVKLHLNIIAEKEGKVKSYNLFDFLKK